MPTHMSLYDNITELLSKEPLWSAENEQVIMFLSIYIGLSNHLILGNS